MRKNSNTAQIGAIFKYFITDPEGRETQINPVYFIGEEKRHVVDQIDDYQKWSVQMMCYKLFSPVKKLVVEKGLDYTLNTFKIAYYHDVNNKLYEAYTHPLNVEKNVQDVMRIIDEKLKSFYQNTMTASAELSEIFIKEAANDMISEEALIAKSYRHALLSKEFITNTDLETPDIVELYNTRSREIDREFEVTTNSLNMFVGFRDKRLLIDIDDTIHPTLIQPLNRMLRGGLHSQTLTGFASLTGTGKSTMLFTLAADALKCGQNVCFVNLEMNDPDVYAIMMSALSGFPCDEILKNLTNASYMDKVWEKIDSLHIGTFALASNRGKSIPCDMTLLRNDIKSREKMISYQTGKEFRFDVVLIDYLYLMTPVRRVTSNMQRDQIYKQLVIEAHEFAQNDRYAVVSVFQLNRGAASKVKSGDDFFMDDLAESFGALSDIDNMFVMKKDGDGTIVTDVKIRKMYTGDKIYFKLPYLEDNCVYDSAQAKIIDRTIIQDDEDENSGRFKKRFGVTLSDVLDAEPKLKDVWSKWICEVCKDNGNVSCVGTKYLYPEFSKRGWDTHAKNEFTPEQIEEQKKLIEDAIEKAYNISKNKERPAKDVLLDSDFVKITGQDEFGMFNLS